MRKINLVFLSALMMTSLAAQKNTSVTVGVGTMYYMGDMEQKLSDLRPALSAHYKWNFYKGLSMRIGLAVTQYGANDTKSSQYADRKLQFTSDLGEANIQLVYDILPDKKGVNGGNWGSDVKFSPYVFVGAGGCTFNPKAPINNKIQYLQPLGTEGQFIMRGNSNPTSYSLVQPILLGGIGAHFRFVRNWGAGIDVGYRYTLTDYLDDVSGYYPDKVQLLAFSGPDAVALSDPSRLQEIGALRGNPKNNDAYIMATVSLNYYFIRNACPTPR